MKIIKLALIPFSLLVLSVIVYMFISLRNNIVFPAGFQCSGYSRVELGLNESEETVVEAVLNLQVNNSSSFFIINGTVQKNNVVTSLKRQVKLKKPEEKGGNGVMFTIDKITKSNLDNTPEDVFDTFISEFSGDETHLYFSKQKLENSAYLIGGPFSNVFICTAY
ncbi:hypothetical protein KW823_10105 [Enterobacter quasiroggenkampii]|nr:hypothetical protein [Enterobacter quasiroggenkampii]